MYRVREGRYEYFLGHPGGPYFKNKDAGTWSIPKGEPDYEDELLETAKREFQEETGMTPEGPFQSLGEQKRKDGKVIHAWAFQGDPGTDEMDLSATSNTFPMEWPPRSGERQHFPELDRGAFFTPETARQKINPSQVVFLDRFEGENRVS